MAPLDSPDKKSKVRFHDEVRVKKIKRRGHGIPVRLMQKEPRWEEDENEEGEGGEEDKDLEEYEDDDEELEYGNTDDEDDGEEEEEYGEEGTSNEDEGDRETIERLKDDLFAEDQETPAKGMSVCIVAKP